MEKRRRARINHSLSELKSLILDALNKDPSRHSKLEKADILEMTVRHLQNVQRQQIAAAIATDPSVMNKFKAGFNECASEVNRYINKMESADPALRRRLVTHLSQCLTNLNGVSSSNGQHYSNTANSPTTLAFPSQSHFPPRTPSPSVSGGRESLSEDINNNIVTSSASPKMVGGLSLIPTRLPSGEVAFVLPNKSQLVASKEHLFELPPHNSQEIRYSRSSWTPSSPSIINRRSVISPVPSESSVLSPDGSEAGSDVFIECPVSPPPFNENPLYYQRSMSPDSTSARMSIDAEPKDLVIKRYHIEQEEKQEAENVWRPW
ncbi:hypothetical protein LAZ67_21000552 [Cordylochernes scorpioides]|uniref:Protein deadpan n=1 Tax=Cordylochernes scorpioides TaxID=51811 RepID=A0ABY6LLK8_9ARAC|nr:hypothetical protein LAZ67_21000552 [Cordylochernes scorpioides]